MSKELTKKLENCTLETGYYYAQMYEFDEDDDEVNDIFTDIIEVNDGLVSYSGDGADEVLAPVPSYEELQKLKSQLEEANDVIKYFTYGKYTIIKSRKKGLAKEFEKDVSNMNWKGIEYLDKWGVK